MPAFSWTQAREMASLGQQFEVAGGSVIGREHIGRKMNNQDSFWFVVEKEFAVGIVTDGCTSEAHSEVGAQLGAPLIQEAIARHTLRELKGPVPSRAWFTREAFWENIRQDVLAIMRTLAISMGESLPRVVYDYFLFTVIGFLVTPTVSVFFSIGDGVIVVNGELLTIGPFPDNKPPYLAFSLLNPDLVGMDPKLFKFQIQRTVPTVNLSSFVVGADGLRHFIDAAERNVPGREEKVGPISQFWENDSYFTNPVRVTLRLAQVNQDTRKIDWQAQRVLPANGLLPDDTTLIVGRRRE